MSATHLLLDPVEQRFKPAPRFWKANLCGTRVPGLPAIPGGSSDTSLVLSWLYSRYEAPQRASIRDSWHQRGLTHVWLSWPDDRAANSTPEAFLSICRELIQDGFSTCVFLSSKDYDPNFDVAGVLANIAPVLPLLVGVVPMFCVGWELNLWLSPADVQALIDALAPQWLKQPGTLGYVHFSGGYFAYQPNGQTTADFWKANVGKLHGLLHQRDLNDLPYDTGNYQARITDCLQRFAGQFNCPSDSGFGHPFDFVAAEITAQWQFNGQMTEGEGNIWGKVAITTPPQIGPLGPVSVMGSGNGLPL